jgi:hypothetical protein
MEAMEAEFIDLDDPTSSPAVQVLQRQELRSSRDLPFYQAQPIEAPSKLPPPKTNRERFRRKFFAMVVRTLTRACETPGGPQRDEILSELKTHLSARIEHKVIAYFLADRSIVTGEAFGNRHYFELAAEGFAAQPELYEHWNMDAIESGLRSNELFHSIFAMLFHQWVFVPESRADVKDVNLLLSGAGQLFRSDLETSSFVYRPIYQMVRKVLANRFFWSESVKTRLMALWELWARFCFFYEKQVVFVLYNVRHFHLQELLEGARERGAVLVLKKDEYENVNLNGAFVRYVISQLLQVKSARVFQRYMHFTGNVFSKMTLSAGGTETVCHSSNR